MVPSLSVCHMVDMTVLGDEEEDMFFLLLSLECAFVLCLWMCIVCMPHGSTSSELVYSGSWLCEMLVNMIMRSILISYVPDLSSNKRTR